MKRLFFIAVIHSVYTDLMILVLPSYVHIINSLLIGLFLLFVFFRDVSTKKKLIVYLFIMIFAIAMDLLLTGIMVYGYGVDTREEMVTSKYFELLSVLYPLLSVIFMASWIIRRRKQFPGKKIFAIFVELERSTITAVLALILLQFFLLGTLQIVQIMPERYDVPLNSTLIYATIVISLLSLVTIIRLLVRTREQAVRMTQEVYVEEINDMFTSIRGQRHDFLNHVQVIHTMVHMGKTEQLKSYVNDLVKETRSVSDIVHHSSPALAAFAQAKTTVAIGKGIAFTCELPDNWNMHETTVKVIDIIKIIGNLVDNAFDETEILPQDQRQVHASIRIDEQKRIELLVSNRGRHISDNDKDRIFAPGYTSKGKDHTGLGLAIVQERVKHYKGSLEILSKENELQPLGTTQFRITLPKTSV
ncbi:sensor histidine kinase [Cohnella endophytica]|nr:ATP-binding protein [Cohnella endophytica]